MSVRTAMIACALRLFSACQSGSADEVTGKWADIGAPRPGAALPGTRRTPTTARPHPWADVVSFYNTRFAVSLTHEEKADLAAFLAAL